MLVQSLKIFSANALNTATDLKTTEKMIIENGCHQLSGEELQI